MNLRSAAPLVQGPYNRGFLIAAERVLGNESLTTPNSKEDLVSLLETLRGEAPESRGIRIYRCGGLETPTVGFGSSSTSLGQKVTYPDGTTSGLHAWDEFFFGFQRDVPSQVTNLWNEVAEAIESAHLSHRDGEYRPFDESAIQQVRAAVHGGEDS